ncbi:MAG: ketol-acid reductoisomerase [Candidatus Heimdallarchaeota archaeon]|nr:ketol-acid reductoisomerase [Candidatus Heimdallarchaeota archaeon]
MAEHIYHEQNADDSILKDKTVAIIGYGNQGRAQALNLRDSGLKVIVGNRDDDYKERAKKDGFQTFSITDTVTQADILFLLIPDEVIPEIFMKKIKPALKTGAVVVFASGYTVAFGLVDPPENVDMVLIAPRMIGAGVRECYLTGEGFFSFIAVHHDASGKAKEILLALCKALGSLKKGAIELTFKQEAVLDLFNEQAFGPLFGRVLLSSIFTLVDAGYPMEAVLIEMYLSGEMQYLFKKFQKFGLVNQVNLHSHTSQYGAMTRAIRFMDLPLKKKQKKILTEIEEGTFAREWAKPLAKLKFKVIKFFATRTRINRLEKKARKNLDMETEDLFGEEPLMDEELKKRLEIKEELKEFEELFKEY